MAVLILLIILIPAYFLFTTKTVYFRPGIAKLLGEKRSLLLQKVIASFIFAFVAVYILLSAAAS